jgi:hypothetical protein
MFTSFFIEQHALCLIINELGILGLWNWSEGGLWFGGGQYIEVRAQKQFIKQQSYTCFLSTKKYLKDELASFLCFEL